MTRRGWHIIRTRGVHDSGAVAHATAYDRGCSDRGLNLTDQRNTNMATKTKSTNGRTLTLKDRLSRLTFTRACRLLGVDGPRLIRGGGGADIDFEHDVHLDARRFRMRLNGAVVTIVH